MKAFLKLSIRIRRIALGMKVDDLHVTQLRRTCRHRPDKLLRRGGNAVDEDAVAGFDALNGLLCGCVVAHIVCVSRSLSVDGVAELYARSLSISPSCTSRARRA